MIEVKGKGGIVARVVADSVNEAGDRLTTFEVEFHRYILAEYNTHRQHSRNAASTRAIPLIKMLQQIADAPAMPIFYGKNQAGMVAAEELDEVSKQKCEDIIKNMLGHCSAAVAELHALGLHKQHAGRYLEPWQMVKGVLSFTEGDNWNWLREDGAAQPEIAELARCMRKAQEQSVPQLLKAGQYHLPYIYTDFFDIGQGDGVKQYYYLNEDHSIGDYIALEQAIKVSCARCAAVSYRGEDYGLEKCLQLYERLVGSDKKHSSALEHCATPMKFSEYPLDCRGSCHGINSSIDWEDGVSHVDREGNLFSGNLKGWIQHRKLVPGECYNKPKE